MSDETRAIRLDPVRVDGWFERLGEGSASFGQLCDIVGARVVAFSVVAGVRITSVTVDARVPEATILEFKIGESGPPQSLPLGEFRRRLASALLAEDESRPPLPDRLPEHPSREELTAFIGFRWVLLSSLFEIHLLELRVHPDGTITVRVGLGDGECDLGLDEFRDTIRGHIRAEATKAPQPAPFSIDLHAASAAVKAERAGDYARVVELVGPWHGPLTMLLRTPEADSLAPEVRATLANALGVLGSAHLALGRADWAEDVLRLGIQWGQDGPWAADLFRRLAEVHASRERHGEAIGLFRRAMQLGAPRRDVMPRLASSFAARHRHLAAMACIEEALADGASEASVRTIREEALGALGEAWSRFRHHVG